LQLRLEHQRDSHQETRGKRGINRKGWWLSIRATCWRRGRSTEITTVMGDRWPLLQETHQHQHRWAHLSSTQVVKIANHVWRESYNHNFFPRNKSQQKNAQVQAKIGEQRRTGRSPWFSMLVHLHLRIQTATKTHGGGNCKNNGYRKIFL
jgi:hypothetical protein